MGVHRLGVFVVVGMVLAACGCAPRYTSRPVVEPEQLVDSSKTERLLAEAGAAYEKGVDFFVQNEFDSAGCHLEYAISLLSQDVDWSAADRVLSERRILLYKCRYFLERLPVVVREMAPRDEPLADVECLKEPLPPVGLVDNERVRKWIRYFTGTGRGTFTKWVDRSGGYRSLTTRILKEEGLPVELANVALIESGFNPNAYSRAHAVGMWQFIQSTGRIYGLRIDWWVDERRDPVRSCRAAARHLRDLHEALDSWPLALAAYNYGQGRVERAIKRARTRDYWKLRLARETRDYVPKFMAACVIIAEPDKYDFDFNMDAPVEYDEVDLEPKTDLKAVARACGVAVSVVEDLNPHLIRGCVPDGKSPYGVRIPAGKVEVCKAELARMPMEDKVAKTFTSPTLRHTVRRGETLSRIARNYGTSISAIARANGIQDYHKIRAGKTLVIPGGEYTNYPENPGIHVVRKGETLTEIGHTYRVKLKDLMAWNDLKSAHVIYPGQKLIIAMDHAPRGDVVLHEVSPGETISQIAEKYRALTRDVLQANEIGSRDMIYPGQKLKVPAGRGWAGEGRLVSHEVKQGDTVTSIAKKYGSSVTDVLRLNGLGSRDPIYPGQKITVGVSAGSVRAGGAIVHEVSPGETVTSIARRYAASINEVLEANGLRASDPIYPGQKLTIAAAAAGHAGGFYTVRKGDTITSIARQHGHTVRSVLDANGLGTRDRIYPGQQIRLPGK